MRPTSIAPNPEERAQGNPLVQLPVLYGHSHDETTKEHPKFSPSCKCPLWVLKSVPHKDGSTAETKRIHGPVCPVVYLSRGLRAWGGGKSGWNSVKTHNNSGNNYNSPSDGNFWLISTFSLHSDCSFGQASLSITNSRNSLRLTSIELVKEA